MTNKQPSKQEIIDAIKKKADKVKQSKQKQSQSNQPNQKQTYIQPTQTSEAELRRVNKVQSRDVQIVKQITKPSIESRMSSIIDTRCRYWIENRISQLLASDNFTTREGYSFSIDIDRTSAGLCFRFTKNGTTLAKIDSNGYLYCANIFANGINLLAIAKSINDINNNSSMYVKHIELKNGTYIMDIDNIATNTETIRKKLNISSKESTPLIINNTNDQWTQDGRYTNIEIDGMNITRDRWNDSIKIADLLEVVDWGSSWQTMLYSYSHFNYFLHNSAEIIFGKEDIQGDSVEFMFNFSGSDSASNNLSIAFWDYPSIIQLYRDSIQTYGDVYDNNNHYINNNGNLYILNSSLGYNASKFIIIGKNQTNYNAGEIKFVNLNGDTSNYLRLALVDSTNTTGHIDIFKGEVDINVPTIISVSGNPSILRCYNNLETGRILLGQNESYKHAVITCYSPAALADRYLSLGLDAYTFNLAIYYNKVNVNKQLNVYDKLYVQGQAEINMALTVNNALHILYNYADMLYSSLAAGNDVIFTLGKNTNTYGSAQLGYHLDSTLANSYAYLTLTAMAGLKVWADKVESITPFHCPSLYVNGSLFDVSHIAYTNVNNNFSTNQTINGVLSVINSNATSDGHDYAYFRIGENNSTNNLELRFQRNTHYTDGSDIGIKIFGTNRISLYPYQIQIENIEHGLRVENELDVSGYIWTRELRVQNYNMTEGGDLNLPFGNATSSNDYANFIYHYSSTLANSYLKMGIKGYENVEVHSDKVNMTSPLYISATGGRPLSIYNGVGDNYIWIGKNNSSRNQAVFGYRYGGSDGSNNSYGLLYLDNDVLKFFYNKVDILKPLTVSGMTTITNTSSDVLNVYNSTANSPAYIWVGNSGSNNDNRGTFGWIGNATAANRRMGVWCRGTGPIQSWYKDKTVVEYPATFAQKIETNQTDPTNAFGINMMTAILKLVYPVGAIYISMDPSGVLPSAIAAIGTWESIVDRFLYCSGTAAGTTGGSKIHKHNLSNNGLACVAMHGNGQCNYLELTRNDLKYDANFGMNCNSGAYRTVNEPYFAALRGTTDASVSTADYPPFMTCYCWRRTA